MAATERHIRRRRERPEPAVPRQRVVGDPVPGGDRLDQRGGLTRAVLAKNGQELAAPDGKIHTLERDHLVRQAAMARAGGSSRRVKER